MDRALVFGTRGWVFESPRARRMNTLVNNIWFVYILECADKSFYTGITNNIERRLYEHNGKNGASAKYTRVRRPVKLVYSRKIGTRSEALKIESEIKHLSREIKKQLILGR